VLHSVRWRMCFLLFW